MVLDQLLFLASYDSLFPCCVWVPLDEYLIWIHWEMTSWHVPVLQYFLRSPVGSCVSMRWLVGISPFFCVTVDPGP